MTDKAQMDMNEHNGDINNMINEGQNDTCAPCSRPSDCYTSDFFHLSNEDCMEGMKRYPDKHFDLAIVDPPYGLQSGTINRYNGGGIHTKSSVKFGSRFNMMDSYNNKKWDDSIPDESFFTELQRACKNWIIWGANYFNLPACRGFIVWDKEQTVDNFSHCELAYTSFDMPAKIFKCRNHGIFRDSEGIHPTQKPIRLYEWCLLKFAKPGGKILDTHLGSMSSVIACYNMGHHITGFELDEDYFKAGCERVKQHLKQQRLFDSGDV